MNKNVAFLSSDISSLKALRVKLTKKRTIVIILIIITSLAALAVLAYFAVVLFVLSMLGRPDESKLASVNKIESQYSTIAIPSQFEYASHEKSCTAALDGCKGWVDYRYNYDAALQDEEAKKMLLASFTEQGFKFNTDGHGVRDELDIIVDRPHSSSIPKGKRQIQVEARLKEDVQHEQQLNAN